MFNEFDCIALTQPITYEDAGHIPELSPLRLTGGGLLPGDVGTIIDIADIKGIGKCYTVEFLVPDSYGYPVAITAVDPEKMRLATKEDLASSRFCEYSDYINQAIPVLIDIRDEE